MTWIEENYWEDSQNRRVIALTRDKGTDVDDLVLELVYTYESDMLDIVSDMSIRVHDINPDVYIHTFIIKGLDD